MNPTAFVLAFLVLAPGSPFVTAAQRESVEWKNADEIGSKDRDAILKLARRLGIEHPRTVESTAWLPTLCQFVRVGSSIMVEGNRHTWRELRVRRRDWRECEKVPRFSTRGEGRWISSRAQLSVEESWRINDEAWFLDLRLGEGVPYGDAERIVLAIRRRALVNRLPSFIGSLKLDTSMPAIDANVIDRINKRREPGGYEVRTGKATGLVLDVAVVGDTVELRNVGTWMVRSDAPPNVPLQPTSGAAVRNWFDKA